MAAADIRLYTRTFVLPLPADFRAEEVLAFHGRDREALCERVGVDFIEKAIVWWGIPLMVTLRLGAGEVECVARSEVRVPPGVLTRLPAMLRGLLGLAAPSREFEERMRDDPVLGPLVRRRPGLRIPQAGTVFEATTWAIMGQQVHLGLALSLRRSLVRMAGRPFHGGLWCYPDAGAVAPLDPDALGRAGFSRAKAAAVLEVARRTVAGEIDMRPYGDAEAMAQRLLAIKGIGPWTVNYTLLRGMAAADCSLHGDVAVRNALGRCLARDDRITVAEAETLLAPYRPYRSLAAAHLWASLKDDPE